MLVAEQVGTLAALASGRFILQCAIGAGDAQFAGMGADISRRPSSFEAGLATVRRLLAGEPLDGGARIAPVPTEPVEVWIGGHVDAAIDRAARLGEGWLAGPDLTPPRARELLERYRQRCDAHGRAPTAVAIRRDIHVGADAADAERVAGQVLARGYRGFDPAALIIGGRAEAGAAFGDLAAMGYTHVIVRHLADDQAEVLASFERLRGVREMVLDG